MDIIKWGKTRSIAFEEKEKEELSQLSICLPEPTAHIVRKTERDDADTDHVLNFDIIV
jgi:hypothetical protein